MKALILAAALGAGTLDGEVCETCAPRKLCAPHAAAVAAALSEIEDDLEDDDAEVRSRALARVGELNGAHTNAPAKEVTEVIADALEDDDLTVRTMAAELLGKWQDPELAVKALTRASPKVGHLLGEVKRSHPDAEAAMKFAIALVDSTAAYRDDRSVEALGNILERQASAIYGDVVYRIVDGLTRLGTQDGLEAVLTYYLLMEDFETFTRLEKHIHEKLTEVASAHGLEGAPPWSDEGMSRAWRDWYKKNGRKLPRKLGKAKLTDGV